MVEEQINEVLAEVAAVGVHYHMLTGTSDRLPMRCIVLPQLDWEPGVIEEKLGVALPPELKALWDKASGLVLFEDLTYRQWGLVIWSPDQAMVRHERLAAERMSVDGDLRQGDFVIGEFLGDLELPIIRCDPTASDFGSIVIAREIDPREEWPTVATSLSEFLRTFLRTNLSRFGVKYWDY